MIAIVAVTTVVDPRCVMLRRTHITRNKYIFIVRFCRQAAMGKWPFEKDTRKSRPLRQQTRRPGAAATNHLKQIPQADERLNGLIVRMREGHTGRRADRSTAWPLGLAAVRRSICHTNQWINELDELNSPSSIDVIATSSAK